MTGVEYPVPFATVHVEDTDCGLVWYGPPGWKWGWFYPLFCHREEITRGQDGRVRPVLRLRPLVRHRLDPRMEEAPSAFPTVFVRPSIADLTGRNGASNPRARAVPPRPDPGRLARLAELPASVLSRMTAGALAISQIASPRAMLPACSVVSR